MDKSNARRRRNSAAEPLPATLASQQPHAKRTAAKSKCTGMTSAALPKGRVNSVSVMVQPTSRTDHARQRNNNNSSNVNVNGRWTARRDTPTELAASTSRHAASTAPTALANRGVHNPHASSSLVEAHQQLELMLSHIERSTEFMAASSRRRKRPPLKLGTRLKDQVLPPVTPRGTPVSSARHQRIEGGMEAGGGAEFVARTAAAAAAAAGEGTRLPVEYQLATTLTMAVGTTTTTMSAFVGNKTRGKPVEPVVPLAQNPQMLTPSKRMALLELLSRVEQQDQKAIDELRNEVGGAGGDPDVDGGMCRTLQMLPLTLNSLDSPYCESYWAGAGLVNVKERQRLEELMTRRYRDVKEPHAFLPNALEDEAKDDLMDEEIYREQQAAMSPEQRERQQQAMDERVELDKQKKEVGEWRVKHNQKRLKREEQQQQQLVKMPAQPKKPKIAKPVLRKRYVNPPMEPLLPPLPRETVHIVPKPKRWHQQELEEQDAKGDLEEEQYHNENETDCNDMTDSQCGEDEGADDDDGNGDGNKTPRPDDDLSSAVNEKLHDLFVQRLNFQAQCGRSNLYNNCQLFSDITTTLSEELINSIDESLGRRLTEKKH